MDNQTLSKTGDFVVRQSATVNRVVAIAFLLVFAVSALISELGWKELVGGFSILVLPAFYFLRQSRQQTELLKINRQGFFQSGKLVADWSQFDKAWLDQQSKTLMSLQDNFVIRFRYYSPDGSKLITRTIPMSNTQDKADEEILRAIRFYYELAAGETMVS